jgi:hypothetical protein
MLAKPFIRREQTLQDKFTVASLFGVRKYSGQVGIEVEVEGNKFPKQSLYGDDNPQGASLIPKTWRYTHDGSLRGTDNAEYVTAVPLKFDEAQQAVKDLWKMFDKFGSVLDDSNRTSVHVHVNVQTFRLNRLCALAALYFCVEDVLTAWCGDHRVGNLFCLRAKDAPAIVSKLRRLISEHDIRRITNDDGLHYSAFNIQAMAKFGSIEIRTLRGVTEPEPLITWVGIIQHLYDLSATYASNPCEIIEGYSGRPYTEFLEGILGPYTSQVLSECGMSGQEIRDATLEGVRIAQHLCYCRDWSKFPTEEVSPDPFGRSFEQIQAAQNSDMTSPSPFPVAFNWVGPATLDTGTTLAYNTATSSFVPVEELTDDQLDELEAIWENEEEPDYDPEF